MGDRDTPLSGGLPHLKKQHHRRRWLIIIIVGVVLILGTAFFGIYSWYTSNLEPRDSRATHKIRIQIKTGQTTAEIARSLEKQAIIKSAAGLEWYVRLERPKAILQAGSYALSPQLSIPSLVKHLESGKTDLFMITILPGNTLEDIKKTFLSYGYSTKEIDTAFKATYNQPLLADKPPGLDLEGYIFPETFEMQSSGTLQDLLKRDFETLYSRLQSDGLIDTFKAHNLNIHQALTLASIIQKEASGALDQRHIAQVFYKRLSLDMKLETDPTFIYAAKKLGIEPSITIDSPYNTRLYKGLPPGPIGNMNYSALEALANPTVTDSLYFVAGDDGTNYFSKTIEEHEANVQKYCHKLCQ